MPGYKAEGHDRRGAVLTAEELRLVRMYRECDRRAKEAVLAEAEHQRRWRGRLRVC